MTPGAPSRHSRSIVVVGAGFSGVALVVHLMKACGPETDVVLVNESGRMARGLAYGTRSAVHLLNVPAGNMSALADDPGHFLRYCRRELGELGELGPADFVPRQRYGDYLESLLDSHERIAGPGPRLRRVVGRVSSIRPHAAQAGAAAAVALDDGTVLQADAVALAFGHFPPRSPLSASDEQAAGNAFIRDPWAADALASIAPDDAVMLIGAGLTAMDVTLALEAQGQRGPIVSVSRRGLAPQPHRGPHHHPPADDAPWPVSKGRSLRALTAALRDRARSDFSAGRDWRDLMVALRARTPELWGALTDADRARFLRHLRPYWEVLRHRCAPQAHAMHERLVAEGRLERIAGRVEHVRGGSASLQITLRPRGGGESITRPAGAIVNCTGPTSDLRRSGSRLVQQLVSDGLLVPDPLALGVLTDASYRAVRSDGTPVPWLRYLGPLLRATHWEATAVPELRGHAARLAQLLGRDL